MNPSQIIGSAKDFVNETRSSAGLIGVHGKDLARTGVEILQEAREVVVESGRESVRLLGRTRDELQRTLGEGIDRIRYKLTHLNTPTHREQAQARKEEIRHKKQRKRGAADAQREPA